MEPFHETRDVKGFTCGNKDLDEFLTTKEVETYEGQGLGRTYLVYYDGALVAYFTVSNDSLRFDYLKRRKSFSIPSKKIVDAYPATKIGRLAVATEWQNRGVGRYLIGYIAKVALETGEKSGVRLLIVEAKPGSVPFYEKCGFELTFETKRERGKVNRTMFMDLQSVENLHMVKSVRLSEKAYAALRAAKGANESYSDAILAVLARKDPRAIVGRLEMRKDSERLFRRMRAADLNDRIAIEVPKDLDATRLVREWRGARHGPRRRR